MVVPAGVGRHGAAAQLGLVHHVVVVERGEVGQLDDARRGDHVVDVGVLAGLGGQQHQQRPEPLAAGLHQVAGRLGDEAGPAADVPRQRLLDLGQPVAAGAPRGPRRGPGKRGPDCCVGHLRNCPASPARLSTGPGMMPSTRVARADGDGGGGQHRRVHDVRRGAGTGSWKNISTMTRT